MAVQMDIQIAEDLSESTEEPPPSHLLLAGHNQPGRVKPAKPQSLVYELSGLMKVSNLIMTIAVKINPPMYCPSPCKWNRC